MDTNASILAASGFGLVWPILQFVIGLGLMVFVHELGHFLAAKAVGIKVERFALGFGPRAFGIVKGETDYCVNLLPLGGYIKMLGQEDFAPLQENKKPDPRSYEAKSVGARMIVISAGVVMNAITAFVMFTVIAMIGYEFQAPVLGTVQPHFPAAEARFTWNQGLEASTQPVVTTGMKIGDRVTAVDGKGVMLSIIGRDISRFDHLAIVSAMSDREDTYKFTIEREVDGNTWQGTGRVGVKMHNGKLSFGLGPARSTQVIQLDPDTIRPPQDPFNAKDRVIAIAGQKIEHSWQVEPALSEASGLSVPVTVLRDGNEVVVTAPRLIRSKMTMAYLPDGTKLDLNDYEIGLEDDSTVLTSYETGKKTTCPKDNIRFVASDQGLDILGMTPRLMVSAILKGSPAEKAGMKPGDVVVNYGDTPRPTNKNLHETSKKAVEGDNKGVTLVVERDGKTLDSLNIKPIKSKKSAIVGFVPGMDLSHPVVAYVRPDSPAAKAGVEGGSIIEKVNDSPVANWMDVFAALRDLGGKDVTLTIRRSARPDAEVATVSIGTLDSQAFDANDYEFEMFISPLTKGFLEPIKHTVRKTGLGEAMVWSLREAGGFMVSTYVSIRSLVLGNVSANQFVGPLGMGSIAVQMAERGFMPFVYFMAIISAILAVMNFLPFPVVDGGHAVFLIIEKIRGKPLPIKVMNITQLAGLALLGLVFVALTYQDITRFFM